MYKKRPSHMPHSTHTTTTTTRTDMCTSPNSCCHATACEFWRALAGLLPIIVAIFLSPRRAYALSCIAKINGATTWPNKPIPTMCFYGSPLLRKCISSRVNTVATVPQPSSDSAPLQGQRTTITSPINLVVPI